MKDRYSGTWHNEHGSEVHLEVGVNGLLTGRFTSGVGLARQRPFDLVGFASGELIVFSVNFGELRSLTSWVGHLILDGNDKILQTMWHMAVQVPHPEGAAKELWKTVWSGADSFRPGAAGPARPHKGTPPMPLWTE